jgi:DNA-binding CsgD family transcriptional regulator
MRVRAPHDDPPALTSREKEVISLLADGASSGEIGLALGISSRTVEHHVRLIVRKLGAKNRTHAVVIALRRMKRSFLDHEPATTFGEHWRSPKRVCVSLVDVHLIQTVTNFFAPKKDELCTHLCGWINRRLFDVENYHALHQRRVWSDRH